MQRCPRPDCRRAGDSLGNCADKVLGCPRYVTVVAKKDITLHCRSCSLTQSVPVAELMKASRSPFRCAGDTSTCKAVLIAPSAKG